MINSVNLQLVTTSPIWNKTKMRELVKKVNSEEDKQNTFKTPMPNPKFQNKRRVQGALSDSQKVIGGVIMHNLYQP